MPYPLPLTRTEAYLAYKAGVIQQSDLKPSLAVPRNGIDAWLAYWTGLAADYPKREDGTPHILQEEEAYIAYLCGVINEYPEKCLRRVGAYLRYLISSRWGRPDHPLNREELYLSLIKTQVIPSGDPSSDITIDGTAKAPFVDVKMYGDTFQQTYTGKNLFDNSTLYHGYYNLTSPYTKVADEKYRTVDMTLKAGTYTFSCDLTDCYILRWLGDNTNHVVNINKNTLTFTTTTDGTVRVCIRNASTSTITQDVKCQVELGSTATAYEPYVGGTASPNPAYPQPIQTVTGLQTVEVSGKNLLSSVWEPGSYSTVDGGKQTLANTYRTAEKVAVQSDTTYIVSRDSAGLAMNYFEYDANGNFLAYALKSANQSITTGQTTKFITMSRSQTGGFEKMMLESGSTITTYEPYSSNAYEINLAGKNLFNKDSYQVINAYFNTSTTTITSNVSNRTLYIPCEPNTTYTVSKRAGAVFSVGYTDSLPAIGTSVYEIQGGSTLSSQTLTTGANAKYLVCRFYQTVQDTITQAQMAASIQIEKGSVATSYAPYFTPIELCKIGDYQDYIYKDGGDWKVHKATVSAIIDGSESWDTSGTNTFYVANIYSKIGNSIQSASTGEMYASHFTIADITSSNTLVGASLRVDSAHNVSNLRIRLQDMSGGVAGFRQMLSAKKPSIYARRLTPTDTTITDTNLIAQLEALVNGGAENGTTYIKVKANDPNLPGLLYVEAPKYE